jgi:hypothetical protein
VRSPRGNNRSDNDCGDHDRGGYDHGGYDDDSQAAVEAGERRC